MPAKFKPTEKTLDRRTKQYTTEHFYLKQTPVAELLKSINGEYTKPKQKQKCRNELSRRGIKLVYQMEDGTQVPRTTQGLLDYARSLQHGSR